MAKNLPTRPNLDHLRSQAKTLLAELKDGDAAAARAFITFLPEAKRMSPAKVRAAGFRLADAQSVVARKAGFGSWPLLSRYVEALRELEGEWRFVGMQVDGADIPAAALTGFSPADQPAIGFSYAVIDRELGWQTFSVGPELPFVDDPSLWGTLEFLR